MIPVCIRDFGRLAALAACLLASGADRCGAFGITPDAGACCMVPASDADAPDSSPCSDEHLCACCAPGAATTVAADWVPPFFEPVSRLASEFRAAPAVFASRLLRPPCA